MSHEPPDLLLVECQVADVSQQVEAVALQPAHEGHALALGDEVTQQVR